LDNTDILLETLFLQHLNEFTITRGQMNIFLARKGVVETRQPIQFPVRNLHPLAAT
jgi:hypothetical protein